MKQIIVFIFAFNTYCNNIYAQIKYPAISLNSLETKFNIDFDTINSYKVYSTYCGVDEFINNALLEITLPQMTMKNYNLIDSSIIKKDSNIVYELWNVAGNIHSKSIYDSIFLIKKEIWYPYSKSELYYIYDSAKVYEYTDSLHLEHYWIYSYSNNGVLKTMSLISDILDNYTKYFFFSDTLDTETTIFNNKSIYLNYNYKIHEDEDFPAEAINLLKEIDDSAIISFDVSVYNNNNKLVSVLNYNNFELQQKTYYFYDMEKGTIYEAHLFLQQDKMRINKYVFE